jgi:hypothetical protein
MRRSILSIMGAAIVAAMAMVTAPPVLGQDIVAASGPQQEAGGAFIDLVPVKACLLDDQGGMVFRVTNQGRLWTAPATTTTVSLSTGGASWHIDFPTNPIPPGGSVDLALGAGPADLGARVVGFAITADSTDQVSELDERNNTVGAACIAGAGGGPTLPNTGGLSPEWLYAMFAAAGVLVSASFTAGIFGLRRNRG